MLFAESPEKTKRCGMPSTFKRATKFTCACTGANCYVTSIKLRRKRRGEVMSDSTNKANQEDVTFEQAFARLEEVVRKLEGGETNLDESLKLFEEGVRLA